MNTLPSFRRCLLAMIAALLAMGGLLAAPPPPKVDEINRLQSMSQNGGPTAAAADLLVVDTASREEVRQFFRAVYSASEGVASEWTGNVATGVAGTTSAAYMEAVRTRINFYRAMAGVPGDVVLNSTFSAKAQQAALIMSANNSLSHFPPNDWAWWTADGYEAAGKSNLAIGSAGPDAITGYMLDHGAHNNVVGHRRWILYPQTEEMGTGDVTPTSGFAPANATWVQDAKVFGPRPATRDTYVAWPPKGYVPHQLVWPRWSFSYPGADFSSATVTMTRDGSPVSVLIETRGSGGSAPENSIVWLYDNLSFDVTEAHDKPVDDVTYAVSVTNVLISGSPQGFAYNVTVIDPDKAGPDAVTVGVSGPAAPAVGSGNAYSAALPTFADGFQWRVLQFAAFATVYGAEGDMQGVVASTSPGYQTRVTSPVGAGNGAYHLAHPSPPTSQFLTLPGQFFIPTGGAASVGFLSRLGWASTVQTARVQVSTDGGASWTDIFTQAGTGGAGEGTYNARAADLGAFAGKTFQVRFAYVYPGSGSYFPQTDANVGWLIDSISLTGVQGATVVSASETMPGSTFVFSPGTAGVFGLQARGMIASTHAMEWGPVLAVSATEQAGGGARLANLSTRAVSLGGDRVIIPGFVVSGSGTKRLLVRAVGPKLVDFGITDFLPDPVLSVFRDGEPGELAANDNWQTQEPGRLDPGDVGNQVGAFSLVGDLDLPTTDTLSAALVLDLPAGAYSTVARDTLDRTGIGIVEVYDVDPAGAGGPRLINVSNRGFVGTDAQVMIPGFVVEGTSSRRYLVRAVGPKLADFGLPAGTLLGDPRVSVMRGAAEVAANDDWGVQTGLGAATPAEVAAVSNTVGAFGLEADGDFPSNDTKSAALVVWLEPGAYTVVVSGAAGGTGIAIAEVYEVP